MTEADPQQSSSPSKLLWTQTFIDFINFTFAPH